MAIEDPDEICIVCDGAKFFVKKSDCGKLTSKNPIGEFQGNVAQKQKVVIFNRILWEIGLKKYVNSFSELIFLK